MSAVQASTVSEEKDTKQMLHSIMPLLEGSALTKGTKSSPTRQRVALRKRQNDKRLSPGRCHLPGPGAPGCHLESSSDDGKKRIRPGTK